LIFQFGLFKIRQIFSCNEATAELFQLFEGIVKKPSITGL